MPTFSIITTTLNREAFLPECLASIKAQTYRNFEQIIIDGNSTDRTPQIIEKYIRDNPDIKITYVQQKPKGVYSAFNAALQVVSGKYVNFLNSDDYFYSPHTLQIVADVLRDHPEELWVQSQYRTNLIKGKEIKVRSLWRGENASIRLKYQPFLPIVPQSHQAQFIAKSVYDKYGGFDTKYKIAADYGFMLRIVDDIKPFLVKDPLAVIRVHSESLSTNGLSSVAEFMPEVYEIRKEWMKENKAK